MVALIVVTTPRRPPIIHHLPQQLHQRVPPASNYRQPRFSGVWRCAGAFPWERSWIRDHHVLVESRDNRRYRRRLCCGCVAPNCVVTMGPLSARLVGLTRCCRDHNHRRRSFSSHSNNNHTTTNNNDTTNNIIDSDDGIDYRTDGGIVEGVWIFCRHGDRSPGRVLSPAHRRNEEGAFWTSRLPYPDSITAFSAYCQHYPPMIYPGTNDGEFLDTKRNPYGFLTQKGLSQLKENGHRFFNRYDSLGRHHAGRNHWRWEMASDFLQVWDVNVYSTNYVRTILSAQSFLDGLLGTHCFSPSTERSLDPEITKERVVPDHAWVRKNFFENSGNGNPITNQASSSQANNNPWRIPIQIRQLSQDPLNAFDRQPDTMAEYVGEVMKSREFHARDSAAAPLAARLANILPGLIRPHRSGLSSRSPSGINWVEAADHFVCCESHGLPLSKYSNFDNDDRVEQTLKAMSFQTKVHLAWRFRRWYQHRQLLAAIAGPPLREVVDRMAQTTRIAPSDARTKRPFSLYSCHDITILGLLYGIGADFLADDTVLGWDYWPPYASALVFELVRRGSTNRDNDGKADAENNNNNNDFVIRILLLDGGDGRNVQQQQQQQQQQRIVECVDFNNVNFPRRGTGIQGMMQLSDLELLVRTFEEVGGDGAKIIRPSECCPNDEHDNNNNNDRWI